MQSLAGAVAHQRLSWSVAQAAGVELWLRRDDCLPAWGQGNKFYKLYHNLKRWRPGQVCVSFGGAYSNHLHALALAGVHFKVPCVGIVRGLKPPRLSPTLTDAINAGMRLVFVSRKDYGRRACADIDDDLRNWCSDVCGLSASSLLIIPEGGANTEGVLGACDLGEQLLLNQPDCEQIWLAVGTGTTLAGVARSAARVGRCKVVGVPVIGPDKTAGYGSLTATINEFAPNLDNWELLTGYSLGGYARTRPDFLAFLQQFQAETGVVLDHVYTGKLFWALKFSLEQGRVAAGTRLVAIHSGGLQGLRGLPAASLW